MTARRLIALTLFVVYIVCMPLPKAAASSVALLMEEPFGTFGTLNPTGHAAIYLSNVCAQSPTQLRRCNAGEPGVVISRYHHVGGYDWLAIPFIAYLYAVDSIAEIPESATPQMETQLRDRYRRAHLESIAPDAPAHRTPKGEWIQLIGASYDRRIYVFELTAPDTRDDDLIAAFNGRRNVSHFNLFFNNCADLSRAILDFYYPHAVRRSMVADVGLTTPKQLARSLTQYARDHERMEFHTYALPQVRGSIARSKPIDGVVESFLKKNYVVPLAVVHPAVAGAIAAAYLWRGRYNPGRGAETLTTGADLERLYEPAQTTIVDRSDVDPLAAPADDTSANLLLTGLAVGSR